MLTFAFSQVQGQSYSEKQFLTTMRALGHEVLLGTNDSTSRVLPVQNNNGVHFISFENPVQLFPEELVKTIDSVLMRSNLGNQYVLEVVTAADSQVVYSYSKTGDSYTDLIPCRGREIPLDNYFLRFTRKEPIIESHFASDVQVEKESNTTWAILLVIVILFAGLVYYWMSTRRTKNQNTIVMGRFSFNPIEQSLTLEKTTIELSNKESELLKLLYSRVNETVERDEILNVVWGDEGDYIGRTLDVFISKLRKKLLADDTVKILNSRGVGYKLVIGSAS